MNLFEVVSLIVKRNGYYDVGFRDESGVMYELAVHEELVLEQRLIVGKILSEAAFLELKESLDYGKSYGYAVGILARRMYTEREIRDKLAMREVQSEIIDDVIEKLLEVELLDDEKYTHHFIESQIDAGKKGVRRIRMDLVNKGVSKNIIDDCLAEVGTDFEGDVIMNEIGKCWMKHANRTDFERKGKIVQTLMRKGFGYDDIVGAYSIYRDEVEN